MKMAEEINLEMCSYGQFSEVQMLSDLDLDLRSGRGHTRGHIRSRSTHTPNWMEIGKSFYGRTDGQLTLDLPRLLP